MIETSILLSIMSILLFIIICTISLWIVHPKTKNEEYLTGCIIVAVQLLMVIPYCVCTINFLISHPKTIGINMSITKQILTSCIFPIIGICFSRFIYSLTKLVKGLDD